MIKDNQSVNIIVCYMPGIEGVQRLVRPQSHPQELVMGLGRLET